MAHLCHWPGCKVKVQPSFWGCKSHWYALPKDIQAGIWKTYRRGQEVTKTPSAEYIAAAKRAHDYALEENERGRL